MGQDQQHPTHPVRWQTGVWQAAFHLLVMSAPMALLVAVVPRFDTTFREFDMPLPAGTVVVLNLSNFLTARWFIAAPPLLLFAVLDLIALVGLRMAPKPGPMLGSIWFAAVFAACGILLLLIMVGLLLPMLGIVDGLSGPAA